MKISSNLLTKNIDIHNLKTNQQQQDAIQRTLDKAEALGIVATLVDFGATCPKTMENYLWTLSEAIQEANSLYNQSIR